ncbi:universal stress protein, partial [Streptomyces sp. SID3343]|uniref:universal stress protein n=1 Tax=Streptomyces sp. SID3343 TaxID=2690260 RepID=UPI00136C66E7
MNNTEAVATPLVVVGTDGSEHGERSVARAAAEAARMGALLCVVYALRVAERVPGFEPIEPGDDVRAAAAHVVEAAAKTALERHPGLAVEGRVEFGSPADVLLDASRGAALLVTGSRGRGGFAGL